MFSIPHEGLGGRTARQVSIIAALSLVVGLLSTVVWAPPAQAAGEAIALTKTATGTVLPGEPVTYTLSTRNSGTAPEYNLGLRDVLPVGVTYVGGSTTPAGAGEPTVSVVGTAPNTQQVLTWENVADLQVGSSYTITFRATPSATTFPAGSTVANTATAYTNTDPRVAPGFDGSGALVPGTATESSTSSATTAVQPIQVTKAEPSPEGELLRGLHTQSTVYTLTVRGSGTASTTGVTVDDYLPANLEFLGCGATDNSPAGMVEYPGAPRLTATPAVSGCVTPASVTTVTNPVTIPALPAGVYTKVTWNLGTLTAGATVTLPYRAGIPLRENTTTFTGGTPGGATAQGANLANNNGPSTRETTTERSATNRVVVAGTYTGSYQGSPTPGATPVTATDVATRTVEDLSLQKSVSPATFDQGAIATYTLKIRASEYQQATGVVLTDVIPDGLCPLTPTVNASPDGAAECDPGAGFAPTISGSPTGTIAFGPVTHAGTDYTVRFTPFDVPADGVVTVTYQVRMRATYEAGNPTAVGDSYTNNVSLVGTTTPAAPGTGESGPQQVGDDSSATITSGGGSIDKTLLPSTTAPYVCNSPGYAQSADLTTAQQTFHVGDRICFTLRVDFPTGSATRNPVVTDFLPPGTRYEAGSMAITGNDTAAVANFNEAAAAAGNASPTWTLGTSTSGALYLPRGAVFEARIAVIVTTAAPTRVGQIRGNLMKARGENTAGQAISLRDREDVIIAPTPDVGITKGVANVNGGTANPPDTDNVTVREGDVVTFRVDITNNGTVTSGTNVPVHDVVAWDVLPAGITCAQISAISDGGACNAPGVLTVATAGVSTISWPALTAALAPGATRTLTYAMTVPTGTGVAANLVDTASVRTFKADANTGQAIDFYPQSNVDTTVPAGSQTAPVATDPSNVRLPSVTVTKSQSTSVTESNNNLATQATIGELVTYTVTARVPAHTTVYRAVLTDPMPTGVTVLSVTGTQSLDGGTTTNPLTATGFSVASTTSGATLTFATPYQNTTASDHVFGMVVTARVSTLTGNTHGTTRTNTTTFTSYTAATGSTQNPSVTASTSLGIVVAAPTLAKSASPSSATAGQTVTYTLTANNTSGRPPSHDTVVVDCLPAGLTFVAYGTPSQGTTVPAVDGDGTNGCAVGTKRLQWNVGSIAAASPKTLTYTATVDPASAGTASYTNTATLTGSTLNDGKNDCGTATIERCLTATASATVSVAPATVTKATSTPTRTIGQRASFTITATVPANINYYDSAIIDTLPAGLDPASIVTESVTCTPGCSVPGTRLTNAAGPGSSTLIGWLLGDLAAAPAARTVTVTFTALVQDVPGNNRATTLTNTANIRWNLVNGPDPTSAGATFGAQSTNGTATVQILEPHVTLTKGVSDTTPEPGQTFTYTVTARNTGAANLSTAYDVVVTDTVPTGVVVDAGTIGAGGTLTGAGPNGGGTITWTIPSIAADGSVTLTYQATLAASSTLTAAGLTNSVDAQYDGLPTGGRHYDDVTPATATVTPDFPYVTAAKSAVTSSPAYIGQDFVWQLTVTNTGRGTAYGVDAVDTLPHNWAFQTGTATLSVNGGPTTAIVPTVGGSVATGQTLTFADIATLAPGQSLVIRLTARPGSAVTTDPGVGSSVAHVNTVGVAADDRTGAPGNATGPYHGPDATAATRVDSADVEVVKTTSTPFVAGSQGSWTLQVVNHGPDTAVGPFTLTDTVPAGVTYVSASGTGWSCSYAGGTRVVTCTRSNAADTLASGASFPQPVTVTVSIAADVASGTTYTNTATVGAKTYDPVPGNNTDDATATVTTSADLRLVKNLSGAMVAGRDATYTIDVTNLGPSDAQAIVRVVDTLPTGTTYVSATGDDWSCTVSGQTLTCDRGLLAAGAPAPQLTVVVHVPSGRTTAVVNTATVTSPTPDPNPGNNTDTVTTTPGTSADLALTKTHVGDLTAGEDGIYRFRTENLGPSDAAGPLTLTDTLPTGVSYVGVAVADGWSCSAAGQALTCTRVAGLTAGAVSTFDVTVHVAQDVTGNLHNEATVGSPTPDPNPGNNTDDDDSTTTTSADLSIVKHASPDPVTAGRALTYTLDVHNAGPSQAQSLLVIDPVPAGLDYVSATGGGWTCTYAAGTRLVTCTRPTLAAGADAPTITVTTTVQPGAGPATLTNTATVTSATPDPDPSDNRDTATVRVVDEANISLTKSRVGTGPVIAGTTTDFRIVVHNDGPSDADTIVVTDTLPTGLLAQSASGTGWNCDVTESLVTCRRPAIGAGEDAPTITVTALVSADVPTGTTLVNSATTTTSTPGDDPGDDTDTANVPVTTSADLSLAKTHRGGNASAGDPVTYDLRVRNDGPSDAIAPITVVDQLPAGMTYVSADAPWTCTAAGDPQEVTCTLTPVGTGVAAGADAPTLTMVVALDPALDPGDLTNTATVTSPTPDPRPGNNTDDDTLSVDTLTNLVMGKTHSGPVRVGDPLDFTLTATNQGPSEARDVVITDTIPAGLTYVSTATTDWTCAYDTASRELSCTRQTLPVGSSSLTLTVTVEAAAYPTVDNTATVETRTPETDPDDNTATDTVTVPAQVDLAITKTHTGTPHVGGTVDFALLVANAGPTADPGPVTVTDSLPGGLRPTAASGTGWSCTVSGQDVACERAGGLAVGASSTITVTADVLAAAYPQVVNTATVTSPAEDLDPGNNTSTDTVPVEPQVSLKLEKKLVSYESGTALWRLLVTNLGQNDTIDPIVVVDTLPTELTYVSYSGKGWSCAAVGQVVTCTHAAVLAVGAVTAVDVTTTVSAAEGSTVTNSATITDGFLHDPDGRHTATAELTVPHGGGPLPPTGAGVTGLGLLALTLLMLGLALVVTARRRA